MIATGTMIAPGIAYGPSTYSNLPVRSVTKPCGSSLTEIVAIVWRAAVSMTETESSSRLLTWGRRPSGLKATAIGCPPTGISAILRRIAASTTITL